ncbi:hypothetical protein AVEN_21503-1 [Araneus ventricosus]|uniref:Uncharacterized protein n=1 Tax=Araneus ventricosus TaxID=182803 RepID=A0A4Y2TCM7_ARAVE|nr:hypothetical protein AVEN_21503-1 [Araneus ventricosus]
MTKWQGCKVLAYYHIKSLSRHLAFGRCRFGIRWRCEGVPTSGFQPNGISNIRPFALSVAIFHFFLFVVSFHVHVHMNRHPIDTRRIDRSGPAFETHAKSG